MAKEPKLKLSFLGAAGTVTGSKFLLETEGLRILVDCGLFQGVKKLRQRNWAAHPIDPKSIDAVVLTHAHLDHSGALPILARDGFSGPVYCTEPTRDLCHILWPDCGRIAEEDADYANRKGFSKHHPARPLYTEEDAHSALRLLKPTAPNEILRIGKIRVVFQPVGHILGAAAVNIANTNYSLQFSGDIGRYDDAVEYDPLPAKGGNWVIMESTYGDRAHPQSDAVKALAKVVKQVKQQRSVLLIPSFSVGRTQILLQALHQARQRRLIDSIPIFVDSPMASKVTNLYKIHHQWHRIPQEECAEVFSLPNFVGSVDESKSLSRRSGPMIIISASGMLTGGRVLHHLKSFGPDAKNTILLPGFQAPGTRGASLVGGATSLKIHGEYIPINAQVMNWDVFSAHADQSQLMRWLAACEQQPQRVFLAHGEAQAADSLRRLIRDRLSLEVCIPELGEQFSL